MPKNDLVGCFYPGSPQTDNPDFFKTREELHLAKKNGDGYFRRKNVGGGHVFQFVSVPKAIEQERDWEDLMRSFGVRGESLKIDEPGPRGREVRLGMMSRYVIKEKFAVAAVEAYRANQRGLGPREVHA